LTPPNGVSGLDMTQWLSASMPVSTASISCEARDSEAVKA
jgi:hypothetical protein